MLIFFFEKNGFYLFAFVNFEFYRFAFADASQILSRIVLDDGSLERPRGCIHYMAVPRPLLT